MLSTAPIEAADRVIGQALLLDGLGCEVSVLAAEPAGTAPPQRDLGTRSRLLGVPIGTRHRDERAGLLAVRRERRLAIFDRDTDEQYRTDLAELAVAGGPVPPQARVLLRRARRGAQTAVSGVHRKAWQRWDALNSANTLLTTTHGMLPEVEDLAAALGPALDAAEPDVIQVDHPLLLGTAVRAARRRRARGEDCRVVHLAADSSGDTTADGAAEQVSRRRQAALQHEQSRHRRSADVVLAPDPQPNDLTAVYAELFPVWQPARHAVSGPDLTADRITFGTDIRSEDPDRPRS